MHYFSGKLHIITTRSVCKLNLQSLGFPARTLIVKEKKNSENVKDTRDGRDGIACLNNRISPVLSRMTIINKRTFWERIGSPMGTPTAANR